MCIYRPLRGGKDEAPRMIAANGGACTNRPFVDVALCGDVWMRALRLREVSPAAIDDVGWNKKR